MDQGPGAVDGKMFPYARYVTYLKEGRLAKKHLRFIIQVGMGSSSQHFSFNATSSDNFLVVIAPAGSAGFWTRGQNPRRHPSICKKCMETKKKMRICNLIVGLQELVTGIQFLITFFEEFTIT